MTSSSLSRPGACPHPAPVHRPRVPRFPFCTNGCVDLGHMRRTVVRAGAVTALEHTATAPEITGAPIGQGTELPAPVDTVKLPMLSRHPAYDPGARNLVIDSGASRAAHVVRASVARAASDGVRAGRRSDRQAHVAVAPETLRGVRDRYAAARVDAGDRRAVPALLELGGRPQGRCVGRVGRAAA